VYAGRRSLLLLGVLAACGGAGSSRSADGANPGAGDAGASGVDPPLDAGSDASAADAPAVYPTPDVDVDPSAPGLVVPGDFLGLSVEWSHLLDYVGDGAGGLKPETLQLMKNFAADGHTLVLRVGGDSEDAAWWNPAGAPRPGGVSFDLGATHVSTLAALHAALGTRFVLGLNLLLGNGANAGALVQAVHAAMPPASVLAFELGNEPDLYALDGKRSLLYGFGAFKSEMDQLRDAVVVQVAPAPAPQFAAPALGTTSWLGNLGGFYGAEGARLSLVTTHVYPFTTPCLKLPPPAPADLLTSAATDGIATTYAPHAKAAHAAGYAFRMAEMNSVSCGGADGVSNAYASALWGAHVAFALAAGGLDGVNFHTPGTFYAAFSFDAAGVLTVRPLYYGLALFSMATANGGALVPTTLLPTARVHAWATRDHDGAVRVALLNEDAAPATLRVRAHGKSGAAPVVRLVGPSLAAKSGLTLGGRTWDGSTNGLPVGAPSNEVAPYDGDAYLVTVPAMSAALLTMP
jgi:hypothetical protein